MHNRSDMSERPYPQVSPWVRLLPVLTGCCVALIGALALVGWYEDIPALRSVSPRFASVKANTAACFVLIGLALALASVARRTAVTAVRWVAEVTVFVVATITLLEYATGVSFGIDQVLFREPLGGVQTIAPGRMSAIAALCFAFCATALFAERAESPRGRGTARTLATCVGIVGLLSLLGYLYGAPILYQPFPGTTAIAIQGAIAFLMMATGIVALHPEYGLPSIAAGRTLVGTHVRWLFPIAILIPLLIGGIAVQTYEAFGAARASIAVTAAGTTITICLTIVLAARWLRRIEERLEVSNRALAATRQGVFIADGTQPGRPIIYVNEAFTQLSGYAAKEALGRPCDFIVGGAAPEDPAVATFEQALANASSCTVTLPCKRRDGTVFSGRLSISASSGNDGAENVVGLIEDVTTEQLAAMARLELLAEASQARKDAEAANKVKDVFFASITHELRSPLNACVMWLDVLALGPLSEKSAKGVDAIKRNLKIQTRLVNDLIDAAKISSGGIEIHRQPHDVGALLESNVETWKLLATTRKIQFTFQPPAEPYVLEVDPERLQQVLTNLLENAFSNTPAEGRVDLRIHGATDHVDIHIEDTGAGLSAEDLQRVFTPFWRARSPGSSHKGLGLGLAIAEHLVRSHNGTLSARSDGPGRGCVFTVSLPVVTAQAKHTDSARQEA